MKHFIKIFYLILLLTAVQFIGQISFSKEAKIKYSKKDISNYFSGIVSSRQKNDDAAYEYFDRVKSLKNIHSNYNNQFIYTLISLGKFNKAFEFSRDVWIEDEFFFETDLLLGLNSFINKDYVNAEKYFKRMNIFSQNSFKFEDLIGNVLIVWSKASQNNYKESFQFLNTISPRYNNLKKIQNAFLQCYFETPKVEQSFRSLTENKEIDFSRYNFFLANYLLHKNKVKEAKKVIIDGRTKYDSNLLIKQSEIFFQNEKSEKIKNFFNCKNPKDSLAEFFYIMANFNSTEKDYELSNFFLKISFFLNDKFTPNKTLLAENLFFQKKFKETIKIYELIKSIGSDYSWHASKNIALVLSYNEDKEGAVSIFKEEFDLLKNPNFEKYYELANFYKDNEYFEESIKYYSLSLDKIEKNHHLIPKILDRRGTSYERLGDWKKAEKDLQKSLEISPNQAHVLNYLAYSWIEGNKNLDMALEMLEEASSLREGDGYIIDSLGWAHYAKKNFFEAEQFLQKAVEILPLDPIINDHYADSLWMVNKNIQARYVWQYVLGLDGVDQKLKDKINQKLIFGINNNL